MVARGKIDNVRPVDDGTGVLECIQRTPAVQRMAEPGRPPPILPEYPPPAAKVGDSVCVVGRVQRKGEFWQATIDSIRERQSVLRANGRSPPAQSAPLL